MERTGNHAHFWKPSNNQLQRSESQFSIMTILVAPIGANPYCFFYPRVIPDRIIGMQAHPGLRFNHPSGTFEFAKRHS